jgi:hypothetical protein
MRRREATKGNAQARKALESEVTGDRESVVMGNIIAAR